MIDYVSREQGNDMDNIGNYRIVEHIGHGAMGTVEKALAPDGGTVAIKILYPQFALESTYVKRFKREAELARKLSHPNVVKILDVGEDETSKRPYIVMEYIEGQSLAEVMQDAKMSLDGGSTQLFTPDETIKIMRQLAGVLQAADDIGLLHRDIKPQNIILEWNGNVKLLDFGFAKDVESLVSVLSLPGQPIGTPPYMSPEQHEGTKDVDIRSDLYSLGCTAYQMLTGTPPFTGPSGAAFARQHCDEVPTSVVKVNHDCPVNLSRVIDRLLAKKPEDRHQTPAELIEDLNRVERGEEPLKFYKAKRVRSHRPIHTFIAAASVAVVIIALFFGHRIFRTSSARSVISASMANARQYAVRHEYDKAKDELDEVIADYSLYDPDLTKPATELRTKILDEYETWRKAEEKRLAEVNRKKAAAEEAERKRQAKLSEQMRVSDLHDMLRTAERWLQRESRVKGAAGLIDRAYELCHTDAERAKVALVEKKVKEAMAKRRPWAVVMDFTVDKSVKSDISGAAVAVKLEQVLGNQFRLVSRRQVSKALEELRFQSSDLADPRKAERFGKYVGGEYLITGNVVQLGREITIAVQCLDVNTGEISKTAEVSAVNVNDFNHMITEAARLLTMREADKRKYLNKKQDYAEAMARGSKYFEAGNYTGAAAIFKKAASIDKTEQAEKLYAESLRKAEEKKAHEDRTELYLKTSNIAGKYLARGKWTEAEAAYMEVLKIPGHAKDKAALDGLKRVRAGIENEKKRDAKQAYLQVVKASGKVLNRLKFSTRPSMVDSAMCVESIKKLGELKDSAHWKYLSTSDRHSVVTMKSYLEAIRNKYKDNVAESKFERVYEDILTDFRKIQEPGYTGNSTSACAKLLKQLKRFTDSSYYPVLDDDDKRSLKELYNLISEYQLRPTPVQTVYTVEPQPTYYPSGTVIVINRNNGHKKYKNGHSKKYNKYDKDRGKDYSNNNGRYKRDHDSKYNKNGSYRPGSSPSHSNSKKSYRKPAENSSVTNKTIHTDRRYQYKDF